MVRLLLLILLPFSLHAQKVYKTPAGTKYHLATCHLVKNVSEALSLQQVAALGLAPCKICKPTALEAEKAPTKKPGGKSTATVQCRGKTKAGNRCKHMTSIANGYCFQHQPE